MLIVPPPLRKPSVSSMSQFLDGFAYYGGAYQGYSTTDTPIGDAHTDRVLILSTNTGATAAVIYVTFDGNGATRVGGVSGESVIPSFWWYAMPSGTVVDIEVLFSTTVTTMAFYLWRVITTQSSVYDTDYTASAINPATNTLDIPAGGVVLGMARCAVASAAFDWTNADECEAEWTGGAYTSSPASKEYASSQSGLTITADSNQNSRLTTISIGP